MGNFMDFIMGKMMPATLAAMLVCVLLIVGRATFGILTGEVPLVASSCDE